VRGWLPPLIADLVCVLVFAAAGKASHEAGRSEWVVLAIVWPFAVAVLAAHVALLSRARQTRSVWPDGVLVLAVTYVLGMVLRVVSGRGIAVGFLVVAAVFLALTMLGWRAALRLVTDRRGRRTA
jgi:FtsH-binding integral membrane protein